MEGTRQGNLTFLLDREPGEPATSITTTLITALRLIVHRECFRLEKLRSLLPLLAFCYLGPPFGSLSTAATPAAALHTFPRPRSTFASFLLSNTHSHQSSRLPKPFPVLPHSSF